MAKVSPSGRIHVEKKSLKTRRVSLTSIHRVRHAHLIMVKSLVCSDTEMSLADPMLKGILCNAPVNLKTRAGVVAEPKSGLTRAIRTFPHRFHINIHEYLRHAHVCMLAKRAQNLKAV